MASIARLNDDIQINKYNVTTWTGDYGINKDGFPKDLYIDGSYVTQMDETPTEYPSIIDGDDVDHFDPQRLNMSGPMYLKTAYPSPAPYRMFPARKFEYADGTVTYDRPGRPRVEYGKSIIEYEYGYKTNKDNSPLLTIIIFIVLFLLIFKKQFKSFK